MLRQIQRGEPTSIASPLQRPVRRRDGAATQWLDQTCGECGSAFAGKTSSLSALCPECAHHLHGYPACEHRFVAGRCSACGWDGSVSPYLASLKGVGRTLP